MTPQQKEHYDQFVQEIEQEMERLYDHIYSFNDENVQVEIILDNLLYGKKVFDSHFVRIFPQDIRRLSAIHWTPVKVARKAASLLCSQKGTKVLDIGSGCGKFCLVGAATQPESHFHGIEQRSHLTITAKQCAKNLNLVNVSFQSGNMNALNWHEFDSFYFYNPFGENTLSEIVRIDSVMAANLELYYSYVNTTRTKLSTLKTGTRVVTFHGFGGTFPDEYHLKYSEKVGNGELELWIKS